MTMTLSGDGTITGLVAGGLPNATVTADDLASGAAVSNIGYTPANQQAENINFRNRIINGDMRIDQRNAGAAVTVNSNAAFYTVDRFFGQGKTTAGVFTVQQSSTAPAGFINSVIATVTTADSTLSSTALYEINQQVEGLNVADLNWGTANAKTVTLSFWVRSSLTGTFGGALRNSAADRSYPFSYTISAADTWEYKTVTISGDTSGTWLTTNGIGIRLTFSLGESSDRKNTAGAWTAGNYASSTGSTNLIATNGATFYITGVQLEVGSVATPFERRPYGTELQLCQRYFEKSFAQDVKPQDGTADNHFTTFIYYGSTAAVTQHLSFKVTKRATPTMTFYNVTGLAAVAANQWLYYNGSVWAGSSGTTTVRVIDEGFSVYFNGSGTAGTAYFCGGHWSASAEL